MLDLLPWVLLFFVPAVTMRTVAEDSRNGILEVVLAQPLTEMELLAGKYLGNLLFWISLALTLPIPLAMVSAPTCSGIHSGPVHRIGAADGGVCGSR